MQAYSLHVKRVDTVCELQELLSYIPSMQRGEPQWNELRQFGAGWWINNINVLKRTIEKVMAVNGSIFRVGKVGLPIFIVRIEGSFHKFQYS